MAIVSFSKDKVIDYVPEYGNNRASSDPCVVSLRFIPFGVAREQQRALAAKTKGADTQEKVMAISQAVQKEQFVKSVAGVQGFFVDGSEVSDPEQFYFAAPSELIAELLSAMQDSYKLNEGQLKNFERASVGVSS